MMEQTVYLVVEDAVIEWAPQPGRPVDFQNVQDVLLQIARQFKCQLVTFDLYQNVSLMQALRTRGIAAKELRFSRAEQLKIFKCFRSLVYSRLWSGLQRGGAAERANQQVRQLRLRGDKIEAGGAFKDLADVRAVAAYQALQASATLAPPTSYVVASGSPSEASAGTSAATSGGVREEAGDAAAAALAAAFAPNTPALAQVVAQQVAPTTAPTQAPGGGLVIHVPMPPPAPPGRIPQGGTPRSGSPQGGPDAGYGEIRSSHSDNYPPGGVPGVDDRGESPDSPSVPYYA